jgi:hypothetical protein
VIFGSVPLVIGLAVPTPEPAPFLERLVVMMMFVPVLGFLHLFYSRYLKVSLDQDTLVISNFRREERIPLAAIWQVEQRRWTSPRSVIVRFDRVTNFGKQIEFLPQMEFSALLVGEHSVVEELRHLVAAAKKTARRR